MVFYFLSFCFAFCKYIPYWLFSIVLYYYYFFFFFVTLPTNHCRPTSRRHQHRQLRLLLLKADAYKFFFLFLGFFAKYYWYCCCCRCHLFCFFFYYKHLMCVNFKRLLHISHMYMKYMHATACYMFVSNNNA